MGVIDIFEKAVEEKGILLNPSVLSDTYVPERLLFRDEEIGKIARNLAKFFKSDYPDNTLIFGPPGTGKTHAIKMVSRDYNAFAREKGFASQAVYVNAKDKSYFQVLVELLHSLGIEFPSRGFGVGEAVSALADHLKGIEGTYVFIFDEIDKMKRTSRDNEDPMNALIYRMSRLDELTGELKTAFVVISNRGDIMQRLEYFTRSKFIPEIVYFREYDAREIAEILHDRVEKAFLEGTVSEDGINYLAALIKQGGKDLRWGFRVLKEAAELARDKLTREEINRAIEVVERNMLQEAIKGLDVTQLLVLYSVALMEDSGNVPRTGHVYSAYKLLCEKLNYPSRTMRHITHFVVPKLETQGLMTVSEKSFGRGKGRSLVYHIEEEPVKILSLIENELAIRLGTTVRHATDEDILRFYREW